MYPLIFLNDNEVDELKRHLELSVEEWVKSYTFTHKVVVELYRVKLDEFIHQTGSIAYFDKKDCIPVKICAANFHWQRFIFGDQLNIVPKGATLSTVVNNLKGLFFREIFNIDTGDFQHSDCFISSIDAYLHVRISGLEIGAIDLFASHAFFALLTGKERKYSGGSTLVNREDAVKHIRVPVTFSLDFGNVPFSNLLKADKGTIFVSNTQLENNFSMAICESKVAATSMGRKAGNLAFLLKSKEV